MDKVELNKLAMAFEINGGNILWISKEDVAELKRLIVLDMACDKEITLKVYKDDNITKAQQLHEILTREKGMPPELRIEYYQEILRLYKDSGQAFTETDGRKEIAENAK